MFCINCGKENNEGMKFCTHCGSKLSVDNSLNKEMSVSNVDNRKNDHKNLIIVMIIAIATILIGIGALVLWKVNHNRETYNNIVDYNSNQRIDNNSNSNIDNNKNSVNNSDKINKSVDNNVNNSNKVDNNIATNVDNYNVDAVMNMEVSGMNVKATMTGTVDEKNQVEYLKITMDMMGMSFNIESYSDLKNGITYTSEPITGGWTKTSGASEIIDLNDLLDSLKSMKNVVKIDDNHFKVSISGSDIMDMLDEAEIDFDDFTGEILADVYTNNGYIEKIIYDFSDLTEEFSKFSLEMKISNYNSAGSVTIPDDVIRSATEY